MKPSLIFRMVSMAALVLVYSGVGAALSVRAANPSSDIVEFGGNATLGGDIAELGDAMWEWNKDNFGSNCNALTSKWTTSMSSSQSKCNSCGGKVLLGGYNRFCKNDYAYRTYTDLPAHQRVKVTFKVYSIDTWDNEKFRLEAYWDNSWRVNKYFDQISRNSGGRDHRCGQKCNHAKCRDGIHTYSHEFDHTSSNLKLKIWTNLNDNDCTDESWGLEYVSISFNHMPPPPSPPPPSPPPPSPPPPSPPPPSPPPPGGREKPIVSMTNLPKTVSDKEYDFGIVVKHSSCVDPNSCFPENDEERQINLARGLWCDVRIHKKGTQCSNYGNYLPCMKWDNFRDDSKTQRTRTFLRTTSESLSLEIGEFEINYHCRFEFSNDAVAPSTSTGWETLHEFHIVQGCDEWLTANSKVDIADLFLLSSPEFLSADCDKLEMVKEEIFRKYDVNPLDGILSLEEVRAAYNTHDVDTGYLNYLEMNTTVFTSTRGGLLLSAVMKSPQKPLRCIAVESNDASAVYIRKATYPTSRSGEETTSQQCEIQKAKIDVSWDYAVLPNDSDFQCAYADGRLPKVQRKFRETTLRRTSFGGNRRRAYFTGRPVHVRRPECTVHEH